MDTDREKLVRDLARGLWVSEGRPRYRSLDHWLIAEQMINELRRFAERQPFD